MHENWPLRHNENRQIGAECGFHVMHFIEEEVREYAGEGIAAIPWCDGSHTKMDEGEAGPANKGFER